ncbi:MAG TPA: hypothetical protein DCE41_19840 [Cytophagales bacterium]|nr:hypothetical protein [Cytophagales bacterium]HAA19359.1 hypothetical protein [Cytophagales bacterium]HAP64959.1 hypothetical protein [Cytophagales bacterium]
MRTLFLIIAGLSLAQISLYAQNGQERRQNRFEIRTGKSQIQQDGEELEAFEQALGQIPTLLRQGKYQPWEEIHWYMVDAMQREVDQGWEKYRWARYETGLSSQEVRSERREMGRNHIDKVLTQHDRRDDRRDIRQDRRDLRDDKRDRRDDRRDQEAIRERTLRAERLLLDYKRITQQDISQPRVQQESFRVLEQFLQLMEVDLVATKQELREDRRERGEDRRERRDDRRERRELYTGG